MRRPDPRTRLEHILDAIAWIERITAGRGREDYLADRPLRDAVERNLERVSEAARHLPDHILAQHGDLPWRQVRDLGNVLRHGYHAVDDGQVWMIVERNLTPPRKAIQSMLANLG